MTDALKKQVGGEHYNKHKIQPWHIIDDHKLDFYEGNAVKYILRKKGNRVEDLQKAIHYLERKIELESEHEGQLKMELFDSVEEAKREIEQSMGVPVSMIERRTPIGTINIINDRQIFNGEIYVDIESVEGKQIYTDYHHDSV